MRRHEDTETRRCGNWHWFYAPEFIHGEREKSDGTEELERTIRALLESLRFIYEVSGASAQNLVGTSEIVGALYQIAKCLLQITPSASPAPPAPPALYL